MSEAQEEYNKLFSEKDRPSHHYEDAGLSDIEGSPQHSSSETEKRSRGIRSSHRNRAASDEDADDDDDLYHASSSTTDMRSRYFLPKGRYEGNTGPKGVIADALAFEKAKKTSRFSTLRLNPRTMLSPSNEKNRSPSSSDDDRALDEDGDDGFLSRWRENRLREMQTPEQLKLQQKRARTASPRKNRRVFGSLVTVDGEGYLDAIEKVAPDTTVVVFIYDDKSRVSHEIESVVHELARAYDTTRFVKFHYEEAEIDIAGVPALIAYRGGEKVAGMVPVVDELPDDRRLDMDVLGSVMARHGMLD
ncbi:thioredoxin-like protein [Eremomyces bilateralis CBS 781.70]|uniref:Thioredoxin-like protein n=1 Tax=Eremomyces bilateralis CBS 781.70 TaxID=1392243 RepID=A0A6G1GAX5_9PEZI|nr:thioredoxin-like protein [Eremomyces bilateralis CBS 781.70]KAF1815061.1 thioredoxin-like protein [Eremomyces bilateralis CBS 781.70]